MEPTRYKQLHQSCHEQFLSEHGHVIKFKTFKTEWIIHVPGCHYRASSWGVELSNTLQYLTGYSIDRREGDLYLDDRGIDWRPEMDHWKTMPPPAFRSTKSYYVRREVLRAWSRSGLRQATSERLRCPKCHHAYKPKDWDKKHNRGSHWKVRDEIQCDGPTFAEFSNSVSKKFFKLKTKLQNQVDIQKQKEKELWQSLRKTKDQFHKLRKALRQPEPHEALRSLQEELKTTKTSRTA